MKYIAHLAPHLVLIASMQIATAGTLPTFAEVQHNYRPSDAILLDRHGEVLQQQRMDFSERKLDWVRLDEISPAVRTALIASEDKHFYQHSGVDWNAVAGAAWANLWNTRTRGASTITMQLAGLLDDDLRRHHGARSGMQKLKQAMRAQALEGSWRKDQILEAYLNLVSFRGELIGIHALSRVLFDKHPSGLNQAEAALAVAMIRAPNASSAKVAQRACAILTDLKVAQQCQGLAGLAALKMSKLADNGLPTGAPQLAPHLARRLLKASGERVQSTVDARIQRFALDALTRQLASLVERNIEDGAVLVLDNASGDVLAWVGSSGSLSEAADVDGVLALRQAGSTLKPFLYEMAIERKWLTAASLLEDAPIKVPTAGGLYIPEDYDHRFKGLVSLRTALGSSLNVPAVRTLMMVTPERLFQRLLALGFPLRESGDYYGYSLALGSADVSLLSLTNAYRALANRGHAGPVRSEFFKPAVGSNAVMDEGAAFIINDILADRSARALTFGLENALSTRMWTAVKTGTSKDMRDNWCVGYSDRYTVGVWVGNASGQPMWNVSGVTGAAPVWQEVMQYLHTNAQTVRSVAVPANVSMRPIQFQGQIEAARNEYFLSGTEQSAIVASESEKIFPAIRYPTQGMLIALDPDIPPARQRIRFEAQGAATSTWLLDGRRSRTTEWLPWPGKHTLALADSKGVVLDQVQFEVRGAQAKPHH